MKFSTLFSTIILVLCAFGNVNSAQVSIEFRQNDEYFVQCGNNSKSFYNINDFSNGLNSITGEYFGSTSVTKNDDIITFNGVHSGNNNQSILLLKGFSNAEPRIIINVGNSPLVFRKFIAEHINAIEINSDLFGNTIPTEG